jgi:predicted anti-sigma-YlaC factor YlaD
VTCRDVAECLGEFIDGSLPHTAERAVEDHLCDCSGCVAYASTLAAFPEVLRAASVEAYRAPDRLPEWLVEATVSRLLAANRFANASGGQFRLN